MRSLFSLLFLGLVACVPTLQGGSEDSNAFEQNFQLRHKGHHRIERMEQGSQTSVDSAFGYAIVPGLFNIPVPPHERVRLRKLEVNSKNVSLSRGSIKLQPGIYRLAYGIDLQNTGNAGTMTSWLSVRTSHIEPQTIIPFTEQDTEIKAATSEFGFSVVQVYGTAYFEIVRPSLISLNFTSTEDVRLSTLPRFTPCCGNSRKGAFRRPPNPFYLTAVKF